MAIKSQGTAEDRTTPDGTFRLCEISELSLILTQMPGGWAPDGISFELLGSEFFLGADGTIALPEGEDGPVRTLSEGPLLQVVASFLQWRVGVLEKLAI